MSRKHKIRKGLNAFRYVLSFFLLAFYLIIAFLFLFTNTWSDLIPTYRIIIGLVLLAFAALRFYISFTRFRGKKVKLNNFQKIKEEGLEV